MLNVRIGLTAIYALGTVIAVAVTYFFGPAYALAIVVVLAPVAYWTFERTLRKADRTLRSQQLFVSNVAHELRGPMAAMQINSELALRGISQEPLERAEEMMHAIKGELEGLQQMSGIIKNLSLLTAIEYGAEMPEFSTVDLSELLERLSIRVSKNYAGYKNVKIVAKNGSTVLVRGNRSSLEQIILNLLNNAVLYSPRNSVVEASTAHENGQATMTIQDQGIGIPEKDLPHIFTPFYRARHHSASTQKEFGSGLGLAIVAALAGQHGAKIMVESILKKGTKVTLRFPELLKIA